MNDLGVNAQRQRYYWVTTSHATQHSLAPFSCLAFLSGRVTILIKLVAKHMSPLCKRCRDSQPRFQRLRTHKIPCDVQLEGTVEIRRAPSSKTCAPRRGYKNASWYRATADVSLAFHNFIDLGLP